MADEIEITAKQIAHDIAVQYAAGVLVKAPQELPNIARLYQDTYHNVLEQLQPKNLSASAPPRVPLRRSPWTM